jgi:hypothetical protein
MPSRTRLAYREVQPDGDLDGEYLGQTYPDDCDWDSPGPRGCNCRACLATGAPPVTDPKWVAFVEIDPNIPF